MDYIHKKYKDIFGFEFVDSPTEDLSVGSRIHREIHFWEGMIRHGFSKVQKQNESYIVTCIKPTKEEWHHIFRVLRDLDYDLLNHSKSSLKAKIIFKEMQKNKNF